MRIVLVGSGIVDATGDALAPTIHAQHWPRQLMGLRFVADIARRDDAALECVALEIKTAGIDQAAWPLQP